MNAALAVGGEPQGTAPVEIAPRHPLRQLLVGLLIAAIAVVAAVFTVRAVTNTGTFAGQVGASQQTDLNFATSGRLTEINVQPGDHVTQGTVLARLDPTVATANLAASTAVLAADQAALDNMVSPQLPGAQVEQIALAVQQAETLLVNAQKAATDASGVASASVSSAQTAVTADQTLLSQDVARFSAACPAGVVQPQPPTAPATKIPGTPSPSPDTQFQTFVNCESLQAAVQKDTAVFTVAQADVGRQTALAQQMRDLAQSSASADQASLALAQNQLALQGAPGTPAQTAQGQAAVANARANVAQDQEAVIETTIVAPTDAIVANVTGAVGELVGATGVRQSGGPAGLSTSGSSFTLFPPAPAASGAQNPASTAALVTLYPTTGPMTITAEVPESSIAKIHSGASASVTIIALNRSVTARVEHIIAQPAQLIGPVTYDVTFTGAQWPDGVLPGMSVNVALDS